MTKLLPKNVVQTPRHKIQRDKIRRQAEAIVGLRKEKHTENLEV